MLKNMIVHFGDPVLRQISAPVTEYNSGIYKFLDKLGNILKKTRNSAGLAAPQIGVLLRVAVINCGQGLIELINPEIIHTAGEQTGQEGCLSFPGYSGIVKRDGYVRIKNHDRSGNPYILDGEDLFARCTQHEIDHLDGILFIDHITDNNLYDDRTNRQVDLEFAIRLSGKPYSNITRGNK